MWIFTLGLFLLTILLKESVTAVSESNCSFVPQKICGFTVNQKWVIQNGTFTYRFLAIPPSPDKDGYFALFQTSKVQNKTLDTITSGFVTAGTYCIKYWMFAQSAQTQLYIIKHTTEKDYNISFFKNLTRQWKAFAIPASSSSDFQVKFHSVVTDLVTHTGHHISPHIFIGLDDVRIVPINDTNGIYFLTQSRYP
ncbi:uncharacterized protein LOC123566001 isoform X2 [Mercenaria mercenaria]|uniref:uncharacterized protein LOC123566001 isoform X2 n=1 Tax=Mercenaria mercenaria TaxID=6596 RepID=UPI00234E7012|nr:uncharacterized protein LOC123566001 isoform X2 [Mercenaria mercenaria]